MNSSAMPDLTDYNLLKVFAALMRERSVTKAALKLDMTQASASNALARLRLALNDRLLEREGNTMVPTLSARNLWGELEEALNIMEDALGNFARFDPKTFVGEFRIGIADYVLELSGAEIAGAISELAPQARVSLLPSDPPADDGHGLFSDQYDVVIGPGWRLTPGLAHKRLFTEDFVGLVDQGHPLANTEVTISAFMAFPHVLVSGKGIVPGNIDAALDAQGHRRTVALSTTSFASVPHLLLGSERVFSIGRSLGLRYVAHYPLSLFDLPIAAAPFDVALAWHPRNTSGTRHSWLRQTIATACRPQEKLLHQQG
jgi:DNA-binding transcriptional LysR family regulator